MAKFRLGDVWHTDFSPSFGHEQDGPRPALIVSADDYNDLDSEMLLVIPITTTDWGFPWHVKIEPTEGGVSAPSYIMCEQVRACSTLRLTHRMGTVSLATRDAVKDHLFRLYDL